MFHTKQQQSPVCTLSLQGMEGETSKRAEKRDTLTLSIVLAKPEMALGTLSPQGMAFSNEIPQITN